VNAVLSACEAAPAVICSSDLAEHPILVGLAYLQLAVRPHVYALCIPLSPHPAHTCQQCLCALTPPPPPLPPSPLPARLTPQPPLTPPPTTTPTSSAGGGLGGRSQRGNLCSYRGRTRCSCAGSLWPFGTGRRSTLWGHHVRVRRLLQHEKL
jgi:hypothetical protein